MKRGLVLEGGAMRGMFTMGILDLFLEENIIFDGMIGVSAGAAFGCNFKSRQHGRALRYNKRFCRDKRFCSWRSWWNTGDLFGADFCYRELPNELDIFDRETFEKNPMEFFLVCTDVFSGKPHYQKCGKVDEECFQWMRASASMPLVSNIVQVGNGCYLDGAIADSIPLKFFENIGYDRNVVILTQCAGFVKKISRMMPLLRLALRKYPALIEALATRHQIYNLTIGYLEEQSAAGRILLIRPDAPLPAGRICHDPEVLQATYDLGRKKGEMMLEAVKNFHSV